MRQISPGQAKILDHGNLAGTERKRRDRDCIARFDHERTQVAWKRNNGNVLVAKPQAPPREIVGGLVYGIGKSGEVQRI